MGSRIRRPCASSLRRTKSTSSHTSRHHTTTTIVHPTTTHRNATTHRITQPTSTHQPRRHGLTTRHHTLHRHARNQMHQPLSSHTIPGRHTSMDRQYARQTMASTHTNTLRLHRSNGTTSHSRTIPLPYDTLTHHVASQMGTTRILTVQYTLSRTHTTRSHRSHHILHTITTIYHTSSHTITIHTRYSKTTHTITIRLSTHTKTHHSHISRSSSPIPRIPHIQTNHRTPQIHSY